VIIKNLQGDFNNNEVIIFAFMQYNIYNFILYFFL